MAESSHVCGQNEWDKTQIRLQKLILFDTVIE